ncbi:hypothetical protein [Dietzia sp. CH92]|uniref:hypothetical protein n=1 Tax=Dietzia sp. CH92 TaxID=3051823 RepID=UPI0028D7FBD8|nr:hypothetical protein [Dietzia sp. CH92]
MATTVLAGLFLLGAIASALAAYTGFKGWVTDPRRGYRVPDRVRRDPDASRRANSLVATWCLLAAGLALAPAVAVVPLLASDFRLEVSTGFLAATAAYGLIVATIARYPFERIKRL